MILDVTAVGPLIEACMGADFITGENVNRYEKKVKLISEVGYC